MTEPIRPALTPEEWDAWGITGCRCDICIGQMSSYAQAALALHGQPFGFTREDVRWLRGKPHPSSDTYHPGEPCCDGEEREKRIATIAARIEALLPPEPK